MDEMGLSPQVLIEKHLVPKLHAKITKFATRNGEFTDYVELEDHNTQLKAIDMMLRMHGAYAPRDPKEAAVWREGGDRRRAATADRVFMPDIKPGDLPPVGKRVGTSLRENSSGRYSSCLSGTHKLTWVASALWPEMPKSQRSS
jgi:hypothetical protein